MSAVPAETLATAPAAITGATTATAPAIPPVTTSDAPDAAAADEQKNAAPETSAEASELKTTGPAKEDVADTANAAPAEDAEASAGAAPAPAKEETPEPQNALTEKFTEEEWKALKELRSQLPDIFADAYDNKEGAKTTPITIWGVTIDPQNPTSSAKVSVVLMKFLRARNLNAAEAREMIRQTLRWRDEFKIDEVLKEEFDPEVYGNIGHIFGKDKLGHPIIYNLYGANKQAFADVPKFIRWRVQFMEKGIQLLDFETVDQMVQVHDYEGVGMRDRDQNSKNAAKEATNIFSSHYPEFLAPNGKFFVNVPTMMAWIFWIFKPLLSAATLAKMRVVGSGPKAIGKEILPFVDASELPKRYGGTAEAF